MIQVTADPNRMNAAQEGRQISARIPCHHETNQVALLTGGGDKPYALGMASALSSQGIVVDFIGSDDLDVPELRQIASLNFLNLRGDQRTDTSRLRKVIRVLVYYLRLVRYVATARPKVFHILWNNKLELFDRTLLLIYYKCLGKRIAFTAHNVNARVRDGNDTFLNRLTLKIQYELVDHVFVHTPQMKRELETEFRVPHDKISVIPFGINSTVPDTDITPVEARQRLGLARQWKVLLFFGNIAPYKGLEYLVEATALLAKTDPNYCLLIAGRPKNCAVYWKAIQDRLSDDDVRSNVIERIEYVPDADTEIYFKAADVVVLPYTHIFQSGVLFLGYNFGLPVIASDVGSLRDDIIEGTTGFLCKPCDPDDLTRCIRTYFSSGLYEELDSRRKEICDFARERYSWTKVGEITRNVYRSMLRNAPVKPLTSRS